MDYKKKKQTATMAVALRISPMYAQKQELTLRDLGNIALLQFDRIRLFDRMEELQVDRDMDQLRLLMCELRALEFEMQKWWKFVLDAKKHTWWCRMPHCKCSYDINKKKVPNSEDQILEPECSLHGLGTGFSLEKGLDMND